ncbi:hypothetical protein SYNPS1DRAFT_31908 [Syncephalis pseudoplumigaleata]|uniref:Uncharacterized protein n=1 Tax=Syncephalis pseudoplumigaleata TaxID=1712513 RepID=A0A4P9YUF0_9FUNG|nr:hypothetical protein SYNPS1DRAFT_31908 [Syncephalis pseudoplumigaleata]|eukprot:RKP22490.1 hypothetical protein SYNPS1DRAFT_31908 [Syncephalis pseudoplumigaleata]
MLLSRLESLLQVLPPADRNLFVGCLSPHALRNLLGTNKAIHTLIRGTDAYWQTAYTQQFAWPYVAQEEDLLQWHRSMHGTDTFRWQHAYHYRKHLEQCLREGKLVHQAVQLPQLSNHYWHVAAACAAGFLVLARNRQSIAPDTVYLIRTSRACHPAHAVADERETSSALVATKLTATAAMEGIEQTSYFISHDYIVIASRTALFVWRMESDVLHNTYTLDSAISVVSMRGQWVLLEQQQHQHLLLNLATGDRLPCSVPVIAEHPSSPMTIHEQTPIHIEDVDANGVLLYCNNSRHPRPSDALHWSLCRVDVATGTTLMVRHGMCDTGMSVLGHFAFRRLGARLVAWHFRLANTQRRTMAIHTIRTTTSSHRAGKQTVLTFQGAHAMHRVARHRLLIQFRQRITLFSLTTRDTIFSWVHPPTIGPCTPIIGLYWLVYDIERDEDGVRSYAAITELGLARTANDDVAPVWREPHKELRLHEVSAANQVFVTPTGMLHCTEDLSHIAYYRVASQ